MNLTHKRREVSHNVAMATDPSVLESRDLLLSVLNNYKKGNDVHEIIKRASDRYARPFKAMSTCKQSPLHHAEGTVLVHTDMVMHEAQKIVEKLPEKWRMLYMATCLCHDIGKPLVTQWKPTPEEKGGYWDDQKQAFGKWTAYDHGNAGISDTDWYLWIHGLDPVLVNQACVLVDRHLDPFQFIRNGASDKAYRRLRKRLEEVNVPVEILVQLARADHRGRTTTSASDDNTEATLKEFQERYNNVSES